MSKYKITIPALLTLALLVTLIPALVHSTAVLTSQNKTQTPKPVYGYLSTEIDTVTNPTPCTVVTLAFSLNTPLNGTVFLSVGTFVRPSQCCPGGYQVQFSFDNGPNALVCGGDTAQFTGVLVTVSCFARTNFTAGQHSASLLVLNGAGTWTIESGHTTSLLIIFD